MANDKFRKTKLRPKAKSHPADGPKLTFKRSGKRSSPERRREDE